MFDSEIKEAVLYARVSSEVQEERGTIESQIDFAHKYCELHNIRLVKVYRDEGITGTLPLQDRPAGNELLQEITNSSFSTVLVYKLDRLGRSTRVILNAIHDLEKQNIKLKSMTEPFDTGDASGRFLLTILAGVADLERSNILERMWLGANRAALQGKWLGGIVPYGYYVNDEGFLEINDNKIPGIDMSEKDVVLLIYNLMANSGYSTMRIVYHLEALGIPPAYLSHGIRGKRHHNLSGHWHQSRVLGILKSTTYKGYHEYGKRSSRRTELIRREVPAIVPEELWQKANDKLTANRVINPRNKQRFYLLRGMLKCGNCGLSYYGAYYNPGREYYVCGGRDMARRRRVRGIERCYGKYLQAAKLDEVVWRSCLEYINNPNLILNAIPAPSKEVDNSDKILAVLSKRLSECDIERERVMDLYRTGLITVQEVTEQLDKVKYKKTTIQKEIAELDNKRTMQKSTDNLANDFASILYSIQEKINSEEITDELKREIIQILIDKITITTDRNEDIPSRYKNVKIEIYYKFSHCTVFY